MMLVAQGLLAFALALQAPGNPTVGLPGRLEEVVLPGSELEVRPRDAKDPLVLRIVRVSPHGSDFRYDFEYVGLEPGKYDLRDALRRRDGTPLAADPAAAGGVPSLPVEVQSVLEPGAIKPHAPGATDVPGFGGYRAAWIAGGVVWLAGMALILFGWRKRRQAAVARARPLTLAERLRPLVERAIAGELSREERAQLELGLVAYWRRKLGLDHDRPAAILAQLREHAEAGPLVQGLEAWLHMPEPPRDVDVKSLLAPYRDLPADAMPEIDGARLAREPAR
jgi:hypothetical protein